VACCDTGAEPSVPSAAEAAQSTRRTGDLLRRFKEQTTSMKHHPPPSEAELDLLVSRRTVALMCLWTETSRQIALVGCVCRSCAAHRSSKLTAGSCQQPQAKKERLEDWTAVLSDASRHAESLALAFEDAGARTGDTGMALIRLGRFQVRHTLAQSGKARALLKHLRCPSEEWYCHRTICCVRRMSAPPACCHKAHLARG
jgi:hypothetical protein